MRMSESIIGSAGDSNAMVARASAENGPCESSTHEEHGDVQMFQIPAGLERISVSRK